MTSPTEGHLTLRTVCNELGKVKHKAYEIGIQLGISHGNLISFKQDGVDLLSSEIDYWLNGNVNDVPVSWKAIVAALESEYVGEPACAQEIRMKYCQQSKQEEATHSSAQVKIVESINPSSLVLKQSSKEEKYGVVALQKQTSAEPNISHTISQVSENIGEKIITALEETKRQISEEVEKTGELVHQLSIKDDERQGQLKNLKDDVTVIKSDIMKVKEIQQKSPWTKLSVSHFEAEISHHSHRYHVGTRQWLLDDISSWKKKVLSNRNQPNMCMISGNPGMGKSVLAARLCFVYKQEATLAGCFFFQHHLGRRSNPKMLVHSLCHQFQSTIEGYSELVEEEMSKTDLESLTIFELFTYLIKEPLSCLSSTRDVVMVVIDALDECNYDSRSDLIKLLLRDFIKLPRWIRIILTTRPDKKILHSLKKIKCIIEIIPEDSHNLNDIRLFLRDFLKNKMTSEEFDLGVELLVKKSEGMFLYFKYAVDTLEDKDFVSLEELKNLLPDGIDDYYDENFKRLHDTLGKSQYQVFLQGILMARSDFPQDLVGSLLGIVNVEAKKIVSMVSTLFPLQSGSICIFHKSVRDWLLDKELAGPYAIDPLAGHNHLAILCQKELKNLKSVFCSLSLNDLNFSNNPVYQFIVQNVVHHICHCNAPNIQSQALSIIEDLQFMYFRLIYNEGGTSGLLEDITESLAIATKSRKVHQALFDCYKFIRRHSHVLDGNPSLIFQCCLNEPCVFSERLGISRFLADPLSAFPGLKILLQVDNKSEQFTSSVITFSCDDSVTSCTLSPDSSFLICSDFHGMVYFWDIKTGELINKIDLSNEFPFPYSINTCSVSADHNLIAYGNPKTALNCNGEKVPLLEANAKGEINTCIFSPNGEKMLSFAFYPDGMFRLLAEVQLPLKIDFHLQLWSLSGSNNKTLHVVKQKENRPMCACFSADSKKVFCGYRNGIIIQWDAVACVSSAYLLSPEIVLREELKDVDIESFPGNNSILSIAISQNNHFLVPCTKTNLQIWDAAALELIALFKPAISNSNYTTSSFSSDNLHLAAVTTNGYLDVFAIKDFTFTRMVSVAPDGSFNALTECLFIDSSNILCSTGNSSRIYALDALILSSQKEKEKLLAVHPGVAHTSIILPQKTSALTLGGETLCLWDITKCTLTSSANGTVRGSLLRLAADGKTLLTYGDRCYIEVWDVDSLTKTNDLIHRKQKNLPIGSGHPDESSPIDITHCAVSMDGTVVGGTGNGNLFLWHGRNLELIKELDIHKSLISFVDFSPSNTAFVSADTDGVIMMWHLSNQRGANIKVNMTPLTCHSDSVEQVCYSSQGRRLVSCSMDKLVHLYNGPTGDLIAKLKGHNSGVMRVTFSSNEVSIASGDENGVIIIWDGFTGQLLQRIKPKVDKIILNLQFLKQDKYICSRDSNASYITVNEVNSGKDISRLSFTTEIFDMSASSFWEEMPYLLCCLKDGSVKFVKVLDPDSMHAIG